MGDRRTNRTIRRAVANEMRKTGSPKKKLYGILGAVATGAAQLVVTTMPLWLRAGVLLAFCGSCIWLVVLWSENWKLRFRWPTRLAMGVLIMVFSLYQWDREYLKQKALETEGLLAEMRKPKEIPWVPPTGPGIRFDSQIPAPSNQMCVGLSEFAELQCLCPRPVEYSLAAMPEPKNNNYATQVTINKVRESLYRVRLFSRAIISGANLNGVWPNESKAITTLGMMDFDRYSIIIQSTAPQDGFKVVLQTAEGLRIKCINQEN